MIPNVIKVPTFTRPRSLLPIIFTIVINMLYLAGCDNGVYPKTGDQNSNESIDKNNEEMDDRQDPIIKLATYVLNYIDRDSNTGFIDSIKLTDNIKSYLLALMLIRCQSNKSMNDVHTIIDEIVSKQDNDGSFISGKYGNISDKHHGLFLELLLLDDISRPNYSKIHPDVLNKARSYFALRLIRNDQLIGMLDESCREDVLWGFWALRGINLSRYFDKIALDKCYAINYKVLSEYHNIITTGNDQAIAEYFSINKTDIAISLAIVCILAGEDSIYDNIVVETMGNMYSYSINSKDMKWIFPSGVFIKMATLCSTKADSMFKNDYNKLISYLVENRIDSDISEDGGGGIQEFGETGVGIDNKIKIGIILLFGRSQAWHGGRNLINR